MDINKNEYWILNALHEMGCTLSLLADEDAFRCFHGLDRPQLAEIVQRLIKRGDVFVYRKAGGGPDDTLKTFKPSRSGIERMLAGQIKVRVGIGMTPQGGARWEEASVPDWDRYIFCAPFRDERGESVMTTTSPDRRLVERYLEQPGVKPFIVPGSVEWEIIMPWRVNGYWKTLPIGHRACYRLVENGSFVPGPSPEAGWYTNLVT